MHFRRHSENDHAADRVQKGKKQIQDLQYAVRFVVKGFKAFVIIQIAVG